MFLKMEEILTVLKGLRNGVEYGSRLRFIHSIVITFLFKSFNQKTIKSIFKNSWEHGKNLALFVGIYKLVLMILNKMTGKKSMNNFVAGFLVGGVIFGRQRTPINHQIVLYLLSRVILGSITLFYKKKYPERYENKEEPPERKFNFLLLAALCWGVVMWIFFVDYTTLQESLASSMKHLYIDSNIPVKNWREYIPYSSFK